LRLRKRPKLIDRLLGAIRGQRLAVLGERGVGKTHLQTFLRTGDIPTVYEHTTGKPSLKPGRAHLWSITRMSGKPNRSTIAIRSGRDVPGSAEAIEAWREVLCEASVLLYLFRADEIFMQNEEHQNRVLDDARVIAAIVEDERLSLRGVALVGTHFDRVPGYRGPQNGTEFYPFHREIEDSQVIADVRQMIGVCRDGERIAPPALVVGSMKDRMATEELAYRLFAQELTL
jgi:hypothetical protein